MDLQNITPSSRLRGIIIIVSVLVPVLVAVLMYLPGSARVGDLDVTFLPHLNAVLNTSTACCLIVSLIAILTKNVEAHRTFNTAALIMGTLFLLSYVTYHYAAPSTKFGDSDRDGILSAAETAMVAGRRGLYVAILLSHIILAAIVVPFVLFSFYFSLTGQFAKHRRLSWFTWPIWLYVSITGVVVYWMISPYYK